MPIVNEGLKREFEWVTRPGEQKHISEALELADELMQEIAYQLIIGKNLEVDRLTKEWPRQGLRRQSHPRQRTP